MAQFGVTAGADGWIYYTKTLVGSIGLQHPVTTTITGRHSRGSGCAFPSTQYTAKPGSGYGYSEETAYNPETCQEKVVSGTLTPAGEAKLDTPAGGIRYNAPAAPVASGFKPAVSPDSSYSETAFNKDSYVDPLDITIVSLAPNLSWTANGSTITGDSDAYATGYEFHYDGWSGGSVGTGWKGCVGCSWLRFDSSATWVNKDFEAVIVALMGGSGYAACGWNDNPATFSLSPYIQANPDGSYGYGYDQPSSATGGCSDLVHFRENNGYGHGS